MVTLQEEHFTGRQCGDEWFVIVKKDNFQWL